MVSRAPERGWRIPGVCSRQGASHRRRGQPCQDATLERVFTLPGGLPLTLLAVADGHGAPAHHRSDVGSALACQAAAEVVAAGLSRLPAAATAPGEEDLGGLRRWLAEDLPRALQQQWLAAVRRHWLEGSGRGDGPAQEGVAFSPLPYGSTLGLLLLTPRWWALAGLGDWDLVRVDRQGGAELLSQEGPVPGAGEATASLCQGEAELAAAFRSSAWPLAEPGEPFALVLCTDGIRKSCASDADFLALAGWLVGLPPAGAPSASGAAVDTGAGGSGDQGAGMDGDLAEVLDRISAEGCGDDVSVVIGRWQSGLTARQPVPGQESEAEPPISPEPPPKLLPQQEPQAAWLPQPHSGLEPAFALQPEPRPAFQPPRHRERRWPLLSGALLLGGTLALLLATALGRRLPPLEGSWRVPPLASPKAGRDPLRREVARLCLEPALVVASLRTRQSQVLGLRQGTLRPQLLLLDADRDPLGALIAISFLAHQGEAGRHNGMASLGLCPALRSALESLWLPLSPVNPTAMGAPSHRPSP